MPTSWFRWVHAKQRSKFFFCWPALLLNVRYGSLADITTRSRHVRFTPKSGHAASPFKESAKCQKRTLRSSALRSRWLLNARIRHRDHESSRKAYGYDEARPPAHGGTAVST
jgi:hypothetical protein